MQTQMKIKKLYDDAIVPRYAHPTDSGMDLHAWGWSSRYSLKETTRLDKPLHLYQHDRVLIKTGIAIELPQNTEAQIRSRSGLAIRNGIVVLNSPGTIDQGFRDELGVILYNASDEVFKISFGDRIAQLVIAPIIRPEIVLIDSLSESDRGLAGFGSTGV